MLSECLGLQGTAAKLRSYFSIELGSLEVLVRVGGAVRVVLDLLLAHEPQFYAWSDGSSSPLGRIKTMFSVAARSGSNSDSEE